MPFCYRMDFMDIRTLRYFLAVAEEESFSRAAEAVFTTQPNLSRQMAELENEIGKQLFVRESRRVTLTEEGMFLRKRAEEIVSLFEKTQDELQTFDSSASGTVYIGAAETDAMHLVGKAIKNLSAECPDINYRIISGSAEGIGERLEKGLIDFALMCDPEKIDRYEYQKLPITDFWGVIMKADAPLAKKKYITPADLRDKPLLVSAQDHRQTNFSKWFGEDFKNLHTVVQYNLATTPAMLVEEGIGYMLTFANLINLEGRNLVFRPLQPRLETPLYLVWRKYEIFTKAAKQFLDEFNKVIGV